MTTTAADSDFLRQMGESSRKRDAAARAALSDAQQVSLLLACDSPVPLKVPATGFDLIAEIKKRSPAEGDLSEKLASPVEQGRAYVAGGAAVLSVLTEPEQFKGSLDDLHAVAMGLPSTPVMRKDFLVSPFQVREARIAGASGVLLIAAMLDEATLEAMLATALELGMFALVEVFDEADLAACLPVLERMGPAVAADGTARFLLGVNCRDLRTLKIDFQAFARLAAKLPDTMPWVAESGMTEAAQAATVASLGYRMALVGTLLMRSEQPADAVRAIRAAANETKQCL